MLRQQGLNEHHIGAVLVSLEHRLIVGITEQEDEREDFGPFSKGCDAVASHALGQKDDVDPIEKRQRFGQGGAEGHAMAEVEHRGLQTRSHVVVEVTEQNGTANSEYVPSNIDPWCGIHFRHPVASRVRFQEPLHATGQLAPRPGRSLPTLGTPHLAEQVSVGRCGGA